jgi:outer membrane protein
MKKLKLSSSSLAAAAALLVSASAAAQEGDVIPIPQPTQEANQVGIAVFGVRDYYGSSTLSATAGPILRYNWSDTQYVQILGRDLAANVLPMKQWRAGPLIRFRDRRDDDVDDNVIARMRPVPAATELGGFVAYHMPLDNNPLHKVVFSADVVGNTTGVYDGATGNIRATYYHPFPQPIAGYQLVGTLGFGMFFTSDHFNRRYFGVTGSDVALFPSLGGRPYVPEGGLTSLKIPFSVTTQVDRQWLVTLAGRWERLLGDAADSPVVSGRGNINQWSIGVTASYLF